MNFVSYAHLTKDVTGWAKNLPEFDLVVGIPRSGMLPATILALYWNCQLASLDEFVEGKVMTQGERGENKEIKKVLVIDDSYFKGVSMMKARKKLKGSKYQISYGAVYIAEKEHDLDYFFKVIPQDRFFQWNWRYHKNLINAACFDIDGVLCVKPTPEQNDDGEKYRAFIRDTKPLYVPNQEIGMIVTSRLEKFRPETEEWLKRNGVRYKHLRMLNYPSGAFRRRMGHHGYHKASYIKQTNSPLFVEDEPWQAKQIAEMSGKRVLCVTDWRLY